MLYSKWIPFIVVLCLLALVTSEAFAASRAARVVYAFGDVSATSADGRARELKRGDHIGPGDTVKTVAGRTQLRFTDGGYAALQPNTEYKVEEYNFEGQADGNERSFLNLVRGSVRLVTGLIGRSNKQNFRLRTAVATIGIRGTSGKVSHCDANCGDRGPGTSLAGYGGVWDLSSGAYNGPVEPGQATFCNGSACFDIPGFGQRQDVDPTAPNALEENADENAENAGGTGNEPLFTEGNQSDDTGRQCAFGNCETATDSVLTVAAGQIGAGAGFESIDSSSPTPNDTELDTGLFDVVLLDGVPVAVLSSDVGVDSDDHDDETSIAVTDLNALRQAFLDTPDAALSAAGLALLDTIPDSIETALATNPATVADEDFGLTSDGQLLHGRFTNGYLLKIETDAGLTVDTTDLDDYFDLLELTGNQSEHFIFGADPGDIPTTGLATYSFTGGTMSTAVDGSSSGQGVTSGSLAFDFLTGLGSINMVVQHQAMTFNVLGDLHLEFDFVTGKSVGDDRKFFADAQVFDPVTQTFVPGVKAFVGDNYYVTEIEGFFAGPGTSAPTAAGLAYEIFTPVSIHGVAGFGLDSVAASPPLEVVVLANNSTGFALQPGNLFAGFGGLFPGSPTLNNSFPFMALLQPNGQPIGGVTVDNFLLNFPGFFVGTSNLGAVNTALPDIIANINPFLAINGLDLATGQAILNGVPADLAAALAADPAVVSPLDSGITPDGLFSFGRWQSGNWLVISGNTTDPSLSQYQLITLLGTQSEHFIVSANGTLVPTLSYVGTYDFSGGTIPTAADGSTDLFTSGFSSGQLVFDFSTGVGGIDLAFFHNSVNYSVIGQVFTSINQAGFVAGPAFAAPSVTASDGVNSYDANISGFFDSPGSDFVPLGAAVNYEVLTASPISGVAGFGLTSKTAAGNFSVTGFDIASTFATIGPNQFVTNFGFNELWVSTAGKTIVDAQSLLPAGGVAASDTKLPSLFNVLTSDVDAVRQTLGQISAIAGPGAFSRTTEATQVLDLVPSTLESALTSNPASVNPSDFADIPTSGGIMTYGRWTNGNLLAISGNLDTPAASVYELIQHSTGHQSTHFIYSENHTTPPLFGTAVYSFAGGTDSTAIDGSTIGNGVTNGTISIDFGLALAALSMDVDHNSLLYAVSGPLFYLGTDEFLFSTAFGLTATQGGNTYTASAMGFFHGIAGFFPEGIGLSYTVNTASPFTGVAGFTNTGPLTPDPLTAGDYVAVSHGFIDQFTSKLNGRSFDFNEDGVNNTATTTAGVVTGFSTIEQASPCSPNCTFTAGNFGIRDPNGVGGTVNAPAYGVNWVRFLSPNTHSHQQYNSESGMSTHLISATMPTPMPNIPTIGTGTFNVPKGGSSPTFQFASGGVLQPEVVGQITSADVTITWMTGAMTANFAGTFPDGGAGGTFSVSHTGGPFNAANNNHGISGMGTVTSANITDPAAVGMTTCAGGCTVFLEGNFDVVGPTGPDAIAGSALINTSTPSYPEFAGAWTFLLGNSTP